MTRSLIVPGLCLSLVALPVGAQSLYKWRDNSGKWHFSDTPPPASAEAEKTSAPRAGNTLEQNETNRRLKAVFPDQLPEEKAHQQRQQREREARRETACRKARQRLEKLEGRVVFVDDAGEAVEVSEDERRARATKLRREIARRCR